MQWFAFHSVREEKKKYERNRRKCWFRILLVVGDNFRFGCQNKRRENNVIAFRIEFIRIAMLRWNMNVNQMENRHIQMKNKNQTDATSHLSNLLRRLTVFYLYWVDKTVCWLFYHQTKFIWISMVFAHFDFIPSASCLVLVEYVAIQNHAVKSYYMRDTRIYSLLA